jgi:hypothetical protein
MTRLEYPFLKKPKNPFLTKFKELKFRQKYHEQGAQASSRGIMFLLTFEEWLNLWKTSGQLHNRGIKKGQYVMGRFKDSGPYKLGNVRIISNSQNSREVWENRREIIIAQMKDRKASPLTRKRMSDSIKQSWKMRKLAMNMDG